AVLRAQDKATVLRFAWWGGAGRHEATLKALALFERRHGVRVKAEYMGFNGYLERLTTQIAGGSEPEVMQINWAWLAMFSKRGNGFADLHRHAALLDLAQFDREDLAYGEVAGKLNALPVSFSARVMLWNQAAFDRAGLALPRSWDELRAFARRHPLLLAQGTKLASTLQVADVAFQDTARSDREALQMLVKGRTAAVYGQDVNLREAARGAGLEGQARIGPQVFEEETQYAVVSRRLPEPVVERLTERLRQLSASGEIARLAERYR
ncbi:extracellular solute-binding protein, partial [Mitsuaria sp. TWR114]|uniref:ABC transporter substrate-binding protein n=1 Tax=Mitsuaria sp. TWR114 TaxID=2601731 RepID=UPI0011BFDEED